eukprot:366311-Chlamydomonas_euryale.AAC.3
MFSQEVGKFRLGCLHRLSDLVALALMAVEGPVGSLARSAAEDGRLAASAAKAQGAANPTVGCAHPSERRR